MAKKYSGKAYREGTSLMRLAEIFLDETTAIAWFESLNWVSSVTAGREAPSALRQAVLTQATAARQIPSTRCNR